ncbi:MAG: formylglycine-generating enzyme family protein [Kiritimatiellae bacterium]|nr:formylglycine-generating enzyme family protein [Kiritimatiellia bacterium]
MKHAWKRIVAALALLSAAAAAPAAPPDGRCILPPGEENFEKRTVTLPGGAELTLAWIEDCKMGIGEAAKEAALRAMVPKLFEKSGAPPKEPVWMTVDGFWIGVCEVTQKQWESVMGTNPSYFRGEEFPVASKRAELPVESVSWEDCMEFCRRTGLRLPTEMEWLVARAVVREYAGTPWSWTARNSENRTHPVGRSAAGTTGLYDMAGNVCEWCSDWSGAWPEASATNYAGPATGTERVVCGGCWCGDDWFDIRRQNDRLSLPPASRYNNVGFRVCLTPSAE